MPSSNPEHGEARGSKRCHTSSPCPGTCRVDGQAFSTTAPPPEHHPPSLRPDFVLHIDYRSARRRGTGPCSSSRHGWLASPLDQRSGGTHGRPPASVHPEKFASRTCQLVLSGKKLVIYCLHQISCMNISYSTRSHTTKKKRKKNMRTLTAADAPPVTSADTAPALEVAAALLLGDCRATEAVVCLCPSSPYLASFSGTREPTQEELVRLSNEPAVRALLWRSFAPLNETLRWGEWQETETFLRVKTAGGAGTRPHRDLTHYSAALRKMRSGGVSDIDESSCCFCLSPGDAHY